MAGGSEVIPMPHIYPPMIWMLLSLLRLLDWTESSYVKLKRFVLRAENLSHPCVANLALEVYLRSPTAIDLVVDLVSSIFILILLSLMTIYFVDMHATDVWKSTKRLLKNIIYKGIFVAFVVPPTRGQAGLWLTWLIVVGTMRMFEALARDRLQRLNASPSTSPWNYLRVYCMLLLVVIVDASWILECAMIYQTTQSSVLLLLIFEPLSIAFKTLEGIWVHGFQLLGIWLHRSATNSKISKLLDMLAPGLQWKWMHAILRIVSSFLDIMTLLMAIGHYVQIYHAFRDDFPICCLEYL